MGSMNNLDCHGVSINNWARIEKKFKASDLFFFVIVASNEQNNFAVIFALLAITAAIVHWCYLLLFVI